MNIRVHRKQEDYHKAQLKDFISGVLKRNGVADKATMYYDGPAVAFDYDGATVSVMPDLTVTATMDGETYTVEYGNLDELGADLDTRFGKSESAETPYGTLSGKGDYRIWNRSTGEYLARLAGKEPVWSASTDPMEFNSKEEASGLLKSLFGEDRGYGDGIRIVSESKDEKLGYEKGHKNSNGEPAPWVIRSHEDNRVLASFANKKDAEEHMRRMKQFSKSEAKGGSVDLLLFQSVKGSEASDARDALSGLATDDLSIRIEQDDDTGIDRVYITGERVPVSRFLDTYAGKFHKDKAFMDSIDGMWTNPEEYRDVKSESFDGLVDQIDVLANMASDKGSLSKEQRDQLADLKKRVSAYGERGAKWAALCDEILGEEAKDEATHRTPADGMAEAAYQGADKAGVKIKVAKDRRDAVEIDLLQGYKNLASWNSWKVFLDDDGYLVRRYREGLRQSEAQVATLPELSELLESEFKALKDDTLVPEESLHKLSMSEGYEGLTLSETADRAYGLVSEALGSTIPDALRVSVLADLASGSTPEEAASRVRESVTGRWSVSYKDVYSNAETEYFDTEKEALVRYGELAARTGDLGDIMWVEEPVQECSSAATLGATPTGSKSEKAGVSGFYGSGDTWWGENSASGFYPKDSATICKAILDNDVKGLEWLHSDPTVKEGTEEYDRVKPYNAKGWSEDPDAEGLWHYDFGEGFKKEFYENWYRVVGKKDNQSALRKMLELVPRFWLGPTDFWNAFAKGYGKDLLATLMSNAMDDGATDDHYYDYDDMTPEEALSFLKGKSEKAEFNPKTVKIGDDVWMAENLAIDDGGDGIYFNKETNMYYYDWNAAKRIADILPGWHLPSIAEWGVACSTYGIKPIYYIGDEDDARKLYTRLKVHPAGYYFDKFYNVGSNASFWTNDNSSGNAHTIVFDTDATIEHSLISKKSGHTIRLIKD